MKPLGKRLHRQVEGHLSVALSPLRIALTLPLAGEAIAPAMRVSHVVAAQRVATLTVGLAADAH